jgi:hypothetical protein
MMKMHGVEPGVVVLSSCNRHVRQRLRLHDVVLILHCCAPPLAGGAPAARITSTKELWYWRAFRNSQADARDARVGQCCARSVLHSRPLATYANLNKHMSYVVHTDSLAACIGQTITIKFTGAKDS